MKKTKKTETPHAKEIKREESVEVSETRNLSVSEIAGAEEEKTRLFVGDVSASPTEYAEADKRVGTVKKILRKISRATFPSVAWTAVVLWCVIFLMLMLWAIINSLKTYLNFYEDPLFFPKKGMGYGWQFVNYVKAFGALKVIREGKEIMAPQMLVNSLFYAVGSGGFSIVTACLASYILAKYSYLKWVRGLWVIVLLTNYLPIGSSLAANIELLTKLGLYDSMLGIIYWQCGAFGYIFLIYYATWKSVSWNYAEAAFIDGAGHFRTMLLIMWPMTCTIFGVLFIQQFIALWNDYMTPIIYLPSYPNLSYGAYQFQFSVDDVNIATPPIQIAGLLMLTVPVLVLFLIFRNKLMGSLTLGGLKG